MKRGGYVAIGAGITAIGGIVARFANPWVGILVIMLGMMIGVYPYLSGSCRATHLPTISRFLKVSDDGESPQRRGTVGYKAGGGAMMFLEDNVAIGMDTGFQAEGEGSFIAGRGNTAAGFGDPAERLRAIVASHGSPQSADDELEVALHALLTRLKQIHAEWEQELTVAMDSPHPPLAMAENREQNRERMDDVIPEVEQVEAELLARRPEVAVDPPRPLMERLRFAEHPLRERATVGAFPFLMIAHYLRELADQVGIGPGPHEDE